MPSLAKVTDPEGEIFDDLDDDEDFGARVASKEKTDQVRKSQIMDLNKQNQWEKKSIITKISENQKIITQTLKNSSTCQFLNSYHTLYMTFFAKIVM